MEALEAGNTTDCRMKTALIDMNCNLHSDINFLYGNCDLRLQLSLKCSLMPVPGTDSRCNYALFLIG